MSISSSTLASWQILFRMIVGLLVGALIGSERNPRY